MIPSGNLHRGGWHMQRLAGSILGSIIFCFSAAAQTAATGALAGIIVDASGGGVPEAKVAVRNDATGELRDVLTQVNGGFIVPLLQPGTYRVEITKAGFKTMVKP